MLADDLAPNRLDHAKRAIAGLIPHLRGERIGLIAFAGSAFLICPLTSDYDSFSRVLAEVAPDTLPLGGTALSGALAEASRAFDGITERGRFLIVISDGEDHAGNAVAAATGLRSAGVKVYGAAVGTAGGGLIPLPDGDFLRSSKGAIVNSRLQAGRFGCWPLRAAARYSIWWLMGRRCQNCMPQSCPRRSEERSAGSGINWPSAFRSRWPWRYFCF
jgi:Ca-activated chloride channel family protein